MLQIPFLKKIVRKWTDPRNGFSPASREETLIFGARRPGFPLPKVSQSQVETWIDFMQSQQIQRVICLLPKRQLNSYPDLLSSYQNIYGIGNICWAPIADFKLADRTTLIDKILPFLFESDRTQQKTVVHCSGGVGRTGHVLAAWLVAGRGFSNQDAIAAVHATGRNARESGDRSLDALLDACRHHFINHD